MSTPGTKSVRARPFDNTLTIEANLMKHRKPVMMTLLTLLAAAGGSFAVCLAGTGKLDSKHGGGKYGDRPASARRNLRAFSQATPKMWEDRGKLTPRKVYFGAASLRPDPLAS